MVHILTSCNIKRGAVLPQCNQGWGGCEEVTWEQVLIPVVCTEIELKPVWLSGLTAFEVIEYCITFGYNAYIDYSRIKVLNPFTYES